MSNNTTVTNNGIGFFGLLAVVLITLKLTGYISISWWWIAFVLFFPLIVFVAVLLLLLLLALIIKPLGIKPIVNFRKRLK